MVDAGMTDMTRGIVTTIGTGTVTGGEIGTEAEMVETGGDLVPALGATTDAIGEGDVAGVGAGVEVGVEAEIGQMTKIDVDEGLSVEDQDLLPPL